MTATLRDGDIDEVSRVAQSIRAYAAEWAIRANGGYLAQACGTAELLALLHTQTLNLGKSTAPKRPPRFLSTPKPGDPGVRGEDWLGEGPDLLVISPAHYASAHYATLAATGKLDAAALAEDSTDGGLLEMIGAEHSPGMAVTSGSLGYCVGCCLRARDRASPAGQNPGDTLGSNQRWRVARRLDLGSPTACCCPKLRQPADCSRSKQHAGGWEYGHRHAHR